MTGGNLSPSKFKELKAAWKRETTPYFLFAATAFAFGDLLFGVDTGSFGSIQALPSFLSEMAPANEQGVHAFPTQTKSVMNAIVWPGKFLGCIVYEPLVAKVGYKITMYIVAVLQIIALVVELTASTWQIFSGGRIIAYFAVGIVEAAVSTYLAEISPTRLRGFFTGINIVVALGNLWGAGMGRAYATEPRKLGWLIPVAVQFIPAVAMLIMIPFCPESPRWLIAHGKKEQALHNLNRLRNKQDVASGYTAMEIDALETLILDESSHHEGRWIDLVGKRYIWRTMAGALLFFGNQFGGSQFVNLYGPTFFNQVGLGAMSFTYNTMITGIGIFFSILAVLVCDYTGRRPLLLTGLAMAAIFNAVLGGVGSSGAPYSSTEINTVIASITMVIVGVKISVNPLCWLITAELGGVRMRKKLMACSAAIDVIFAFAISYSIPYMIGTPGANLAAKVGFVFLAFDGFALVASWLIVPELNGRSLEEVDELYDRGLWGWQFKHAETTGVGRQIALMEGGHQTDFGTGGKPEHHTNEGASAVGTGIGEGDNDRKDDYGVSNQNRV